MSTSSNPPAPKGVIPALMFGNAVIGTGVMIVPGTLNDISASLQVSVAAAGQLVSVAGLLMCFGAPLLATAVASRDRRTLLALAMAWYGVLHLLCAAAPDFGSLLVLRALAVASPALFTPQAAACVGLLVPAHERGRAISMVLLGWSAALVVGLPLGAWVGGHWGWRVAFSLVSALSFASAAWVWWAMPRGIKPGALPLSAWREILQSRPAVLCLLVSFLSSAGQFVVFAYLAPYLHALLQVTPAQLGLLFAWFGSFGVIGVLVVSRHVDRLGAERAVVVCLALMALSMLVWPLGHSLAAMALVLVPWALAPSLPTLRSRRAWPRWRRRGPRLRSRSTPRPSTSVRPRARPSAAGSSPPAAWANCTGLPSRTSCSPLR